jgi:hypothetical protein
MKFLVTMKGNVVTVETGNRVSFVSAVKFTRTITCMGLAETVTYIRSFKSDTFEIDPKKIATEMKVQMHIDYDEIYKSLNTYNSEHLSIEVIDATMDEICKIYEKDPAMIVKWRFKWL